jgi:hypothetical protein
VSVAFLSPSYPPHHLCSSLRSSATLCCLSPPCQLPVVTELGHPLLVHNCVAVPEQSLRLSCACELSRRLGSAPPRTSLSPACAEPPPVWSPPWHASPHSTVPQRPLRTMSPPPRRLTTIVPLRSSRAPVETTPPVSPPLRYTSSRSPTSLCSPSAPPRPTSPPVAVGIGRPLPSWPWSSCSPVSDLGLASFGPMNSAIC